MKIKNSILILFFYAVILNSCVTGKKFIFKPAPGYADNAVHDSSFYAGDIIETRAGAGYAGIPDWLTAFLSGGVAEVEMISSFMNKYCFIGTNEGSNFSALSKWADNYSVIQDFPRMAAARIEKRLISAASLYPDDEYGNFYEIFVKKAFNAEYRDALLEETFWIKKRDEREYSPQANFTNENAGKYTFFIFISIDKISMQGIIENMMADTLTVVTPTRNQTSAIRHLQQIFFSEF